MAKQRSRTAPIAALLIGALSLRGNAALAQDVQRILIKGGTFMMGTASESIPELKDRYTIRFPGVFENEAPAHPVTISDFRMDRYEVTKAQFASFLNARPEWRKEDLPIGLHNGHYLEDWTNGRYHDGEGTYPVVFVTWQAAQVYCRWAGGRLPTEAEWEYAARGGGDAEFPWGDSPPAREKVNYGSSGHGGPVAVGTYPPNPFGLFDMAGNVWELLLDAWVDHYPDVPETNPIAGGAVADEGLLAIQDRRVLRGGSFGASIVNLRTRWRDSHVVTNAVAFVGFRCVYRSTE